MSREGEEEGEEEKSRSRSRSSRSRNGDTIVVVVAVVVVFFVLLLLLLLLLLMLMLLPPTLPTARLAGATMSTQFRGNDSGTSRMALRTTVATSLHLPVEGEREHSHDPHCMMSKAPLLVRHQFELSPLRQLERRCRCLQP